MSSRSIQMRHGLCPQCAGAERLRASGKRSRTRKTSSSETQFLFLPPYLPIPHPLSQPLTTTRTVVRMGSGRSSVATKIFIMFVLAHQFTTPQSIDVDIGVGIGIGGGGYSPPPSPSSPDCPLPPPPVPCSPAPPPAAPQPSDFPNLKQYYAYGVIQRFKRTITCDPFNVTGTWVGYRPCNYKGFYCDSPPNAAGTPTIASVDFNGLRLCAPTLAGFVDHLPDLALFHANSNNFTGTVPDLTPLPFLYELDVSNNKMSGPFPANVLPLARLIFLDLRFNLFAGAVPPSVFLLNLDVLFLNNNKFAQPLPANLGSSPAAYLTLANNGFTGPIPRSICNASATLVEVLLLNNGISGCLPYEVGLLRKATVFDAGFNCITGPIPLSFGCLRKLEQLNLAGNFLYGEVPEVVCRLATAGQLGNLSLSGNYFKSVGHSCWGLIRSGVLDVRRNCIPGCPDQRPVAECAWFFSQPKFCPFNGFIPCSLPGLGSDELPSPPFRPAPAPYTAYNALHQH